MANRKQVEMLKRSVEEWNAWRLEHRQERPNLREARFTGANLRGADLSGAKLSGAHLMGTDFSGAKLSGAHLTGAHLWRAVLSGAVLSGADLYTADFSWADLSGANLLEANLLGADLSGADLAGADLSRATLNKANLNGANLLGAVLSSTAFGFTDLTDATLDEVHFAGPCPLDPDTVLRSGGLPHAFLTGCGWPDRLVEYWDAIASAGIGLYSAMISYSSHDRPFARRLYEDLRDRHVRVWRDEHEIQPGDDIRDEIDAGVRLYDKLILVCSASSLSSYWVDLELSTALQEEQALWKERGERILKLIPVALDPTWRDAPGSRIERVKERHVEDFADWEADDPKYQAAFERVLQALEPGSKIPPPDPKL